MTPRSPPPHLTSQRHLPTLSPNFARPVLLYRDLLQSPCRSLFSCRQWCEVSPCGRCTSSPSTGQNTHRKQWTRHAPTRIFTSSSSVPQLSACHPPPKPHAHHCTPREGSRRCALPASRHAPHKMSHRSKRPHQQSDQRMHHAGAKLPLQARPPPRQKPVLRYPGPGRQKVPLH